MIYAKEDKNNLYFQCEECKSVFPIDKMFLKSNNDNIIELYTSLKCKCGNKDERKIYDKLSQYQVQPMDKVVCPKCGYGDFEIVKRGWKLTTGFLGSSKNQRVCKNCMYKW